ncbi:MAG: 3-dehydroquinate synthase family protein [Rectinema sp.]
MASSVGMDGIGFGPLKGLAELIDPHATLLVTDRRIDSLYGNMLPDCPRILVPRGEAAKNLRSLEVLYGQFLESGLDRGGMVLAVGGGSVSDLAGFAAATWMRGVAFAVAPTTLLAMVDASIGGKNGIDLRDRKNMVGTFLRPSFVHCDVSLTASLPREEFASGMAEMIKHGVIEGGIGFEALEAYAAHAAHASPAAHAALASLVAMSMRVKLSIVREDEHERGKRRLLNLGHSIGHAIEAATGLPHGHCVAAGLASACRLSVRMGQMKESTAERIFALLEAWDLPSSIAKAAALAKSHAAHHAASPARGNGADDADDANDADAADGANGTARIADAQSLRLAASDYLGDDKKRKGSDILFALPLDLGRVEIRPIPLEELRRFVMEAP